MECYRNLAVHIPPVLAYYLNLVVDELPGTAAVWHIPTIEFDMMALVGFFHDAERGVVRFQCYDLRMGKDGCWVLVPLLLVLVVTVVITALRFLSSVALLSQP